jgi:hypothetical protein
MLPLVGTRRPTMQRSINKFLIVLLFFTNVALAADPLPSWNDGKANKAIVTFVEKVTTVGSPVLG